jgi:hypothetical protein
MNYGDQVDDDSWFIAGYVLINLWLSLFHLRVVCSTSKRIFLDGLKKLEQRSMELSGEYVE